MACFHPLKAFFRYNSSGKKDIRFASSEDIARGFYVDENGYIFSNYIDVPCGQCSGCRLEYARQWATRCVLESLSYEDNYFVTLTYNDENLPVHSFPILDYDTGEVVDVGSSSSLVPKHLQKFLKDLRRYYSYHYNHDNIRFFACGEYGDKTLRPHYHLILFNLPIHDLVLYKNNFDGNPLFISETLTNIWKKGHVVIGNCNFSTCSYVARYMMKKQKGKDSVIYDELGLEPPFTRSSRNPGIARSYYDINSDKIYNFDEVIITGSDGTAKKVRPPRYYDRLFDIEDPVTFESIKAKRLESAKNSEVSRKKRTSLSSDEYLSVCEDKFNNKIKKLIRQL